MYYILYEPIIMECSSSTGVAPYVEAFDRLLNGSVAEFLRYSKIIEGDVKTHVSIYSDFPMMMEVYTAWNLYDQP